MKTILLASISLLYFLNAAAQFPEFAPAGATWYYNEFQLNGDLLTRKIESLTDTVRYNKPCKYLFSEFAGYFFSYRDSLKIYVSHLADTQWYLLYDFSKVAGDTFYARVWAEWADSIPVQVIQNGDTVIGGYTLPWIVTHSLDPVWPWDGKAILNIGSAVYFVPPYPIADPVTSGLRCYEDTVIGEYHLVQPCDTSYAVGIPGAIAGNDLQVYPNPFDDYLDVSISYGQKTTISICDLMGRRMLFTEGIENNIRINTSFLKGGQYILEVDQPTGSTFMRVAKMW
jgi:hypothetical protein